ncbi:glycosyltransferase family 2 protein [Psychrobacter faecalis]|uniref:glycosyltransferase family 2 protein n=1 Tax=Psychrobacter faecalis TaxID=180588 RepID=UPI0028AFBA51|nr:glycosyltransferase family 2 protein [Psychrobacter faecalis]
MSHIKVSYLIALYNKADFIIECIESILAELRDVNIEICIVDDGSNDNSLNIIKKAFYTNENILIHSFSSNKGKNTAYNKAFTMSTGEFICIFGADDIVPLGRTKKLLKTSRENQKSVYGTALPFYKKTKSIDRNIKKMKTSMPSFEKNLINNLLPGGCSLIKREHADVIFPIPENLKFEDWWVSYILLKRNWVTVIPDVVSYYRIHDSNDCASNGSSYLSIERDYKRHFDYLDTFYKYSSSNKERIAILQSRCLRSTFFGSKDIIQLKYLSLNKTSLKILIFYFIGSKRYYNFKDFFIK